jgi:hypothetical protein
MDHKEKYIKYKTKYLELKNINTDNQIGSGKNSMELIYKKYYKTKNSHLLELLLNLYLMNCKYRNIFQIYLHNTKISKEINEILSNISYNFSIFEEKNDTRIIIYNKKLFNIDDLDITYGKKYAKQLGEFYVCATNNNNNYYYRIVIQAQGLNTSAELYAQMCKKNMIIKNINKIINILNDIKQLFYQLDKTLQIEIKIYNTINDI